VIIKGEITGNYSGSIDKQSDSPVRRVTVFAHTNNIADFNCYSEFFLKFSFQALFVRFSFFKGSAGKLPFPGSVFPLSFGDKYGHFLYYGMTTIWRFEFFSRQFTVLGWICPLQPCTVYAIPSAYRPADAVPKVY
jgi:hypothetical protein